MKHLMVLILAVCALTQASAYPSIPENRNTVLPRIIPRIVPNLGQWDGRLVAAASSRSQRVLFTSAGLVWTAAAGEQARPLRLPGETPAGRGPEAAAPAHALEFQRPSPEMATTFRDAAGSVSNFYSGSDPARWRERVPEYCRIVYERVWPFIDAECIAGEHGLEQRFIVYPGGRIASIGLYATNENAASVTTRIRAFQSRNGTEQHVALRRVARGTGAFGFEAGTYDASFPLVIVTEIVTWYGGKSDDDNNHIIVDEDGSMTIAGATTSTDFPLLHPQQSTLRGYLDFFLMKLAPDGRTLLSSTYLGGSSTERYPSIAFGAGRSVVMAGFTSSVDFPLTANAAVRTKTAECISRFDASGTLLYSSYLWTDSLSEYCGMTTDNCGNVYLTADIEGNTTLVTPNALIPKNQGSEDGIILKLRPTCDSIVYATIFGGAGHEEMSAIAVDDEGNMIVSGFTTGSLPMVSPAQAVYGGGGTDAFVAKIRADGRALLFCTYLGGGRDDGPAQHAYGRCLATDVFGNVYVAGVTKGYGFPVLHPYKAAATGSTDLFLTKLSPSGAMLYSTLFGGGGDENVLGISTDRCGNLAFCGQTTSSDWPLLKQHGSTGSGYTTVLGHDGQSVLYSSRWGDAELECIVKTDSLLYFAGGMSKVDVVPLINRLQDSLKGNSDAYFGRVSVPVCVPDLREVLRLTVDIAQPDTIVVDSLRNRAAPGSFPVTVTLTNTDSVRSIECGGWLELPAGWSTTDSAVMPDAILPRAGRASRTWAVRIDSVSRFEAPGLARFHAHSRVVGGTGCPPWYAMTLADTSVLTNQKEPFPELTCQLVLPDTLALASGGGGNAPDPFPVSYTVRNTTPKPIQLLRAVLSLPAGMGLSTVPANDLLKTGRMLAPNDLFTVSWNLHAETRSATRTAGLSVTTVILYDSIEVPITSCADSVIIIGNPASICSVTAPATIRINPWTGGSSPDPIIATLLLENPRDSAQRYARADVDLTRAPHLLLAQGETASKAPVTIAARGTASVSWHLVLKKDILATVYDTVRFWYRDDADGATLFCVWIVRIEPVLRDASCEVTLPDLRIDTLRNRVDPNPFVVRCVLRNTGNQELNRLAADLWPSEIMTIRVLSPTRQTVARLSSGQSDTLEWTVEALRVPRTRTLGFSVRITDSTGFLMHTCTKTGDIPGVPLQASCAFFTPDTLRYERATDSWTPDPFRVLFTLQNALDVPLPPVEAKLVLDLAPHLALAAGDSSPRHIGSIAPGAKDSLLWHLRVAQPGRDMSVEQIIVRYRIGTDTTWHSCAMAVIMQGRDRILIYCATLGHDTVWADPAYATPIPMPLQIRYTIINDGNLPLNACSAAILLPPKYTVLPGSDSVQWYPTILPNERASREWLIVLNPSMAVPGADSIRWAWSCRDVRLDTSCTHLVTYVPDVAPGIVLTPWFLHFVAEQNGVLPAAQQVSIWTGSGAAIPWQAQSGASWLGVLPANGSHDATMNVRPNTTNMALGSFFTAVQVTPATPWIEKKIDVQYDIVLRLDAPSSAMPGVITLSPVYPNPVIRNATVEYTLSTPGHVSLELRDVFGRYAGTLHSDNDAAGTHRVRFDASALARGVYFVTFTALGTALTRPVLVQ